MRTLTPYWSNKRLASDFFDEMDRFFDGWNRGTPIAQAYDERSFVPACEIAEMDSNFRVSVDLPGLKKEDIKIEVANNLLTISGERKRELKSAEDERVQRYEKSYGFFKRSFTLPSTVKTDQIEARFEHGVLEVDLPKAQTAKARQIEIQAGKES